MLTQYLPIEEIIKIALSRDISFGKSNPRFHLAYLGKLGLIPHTVKRKINGVISGCYEEAVVATLEKIEGLKDQGLSYSQIKLVLANPVKPIDRPMGHASRTPDLSNTISSPNHNQLYAFPGQSQNPAMTNSLVLLIIGLFMGFFAGNNNLSTANSYDLSSPLTNESAKSAAYQANLDSSLDEPSSEMLRLISTGSQSEEPLYIIALPKENFGHLGKTNINKLISQ